MYKQPRSVKQLIHDHRPNGLLIDTNLLLFFVIGTIGRDLIVKFKRTQVYTPEDFQKVALIRSQFARLWTTPNILTETDNLGRQLPEKYWHIFAAKMSELTSLLSEEYVASRKTVESDKYARLGLSDTASMMIGKPLLLLTDDLRMHGLALSSGIDAINLNHLRYSWN